MMHYLKAFVAIFIASFLVLIVAWPLYLVSIWTRALVTAAAVFVLYVIFRRQEYRLDKLEETCKTLEETIEKLREHPAGGDDRASASLILSAILKHPAGHDLPCPAFFCPPDRPTTDPVTDAGVFDAAVRTGGYAIRPYSPPVPRAVPLGPPPPGPGSAAAPPPLGPDGPAPGRWPRGADAPGPPASACKAVRRPRRRGGLYIRPKPGASTTGPGYSAPGSGRAMRAPTVCAFDDGAFDVDTERADVGIGPYAGSGRRGCVRRSGAARAAIQAAPTESGTGPFPAKFPLTELGLYCKIIN